jgi:nucleotide-binding universal stress UspA family protein
MMHSILVALDGSVSSVAAMRVGFMLASKHDAHLEGIAIVNAEWIQRPEPVPLGASSFKEALDLSKLKTSRERAEEVVRYFTTSAGEAGITSFSVSSAEGGPALVIERKAVSHDLIVVGRGSMFDEDGDLYDLPRALDMIVRAQPRPVLVLPATPDPSDSALEDGPVLVAFDGSAASSRALHMFALLGLAEGRACHTFTISAKGEAHALATAAEAGELLRRHGASHVHAIGLDADTGSDPSNAIMVAAKSIGAGLIVMGAYGRSGIREIFGSCTREVLQACPTPLLLHH